MFEFKTLEFPNTPQGQDEKVRALQFESTQGWRVVSETITPGHFKGGQACCLFAIFAPCAFLAGRTEGTITVTLQREISPDSPRAHAELAGRTPAWGAGPVTGLGAGAWVLVAIVGLLLLSMIAGARSGCRSAQPPTVHDNHQAARPTWSPPPDSTRSLIAKLESERNSEGAVAFKGRILLPPETLVWLTVKSGKRPSDPIKVHLGADGSFVSEPYTQNGASPRPGRYKVEVLSWFNGPWQSPEVLSLVGEGGTKLPKAALVPEDNEFPLAAGRLEETRTVTFPDLSSDLVAINVVKNARLSTPENGLSADPVKGVVELFESGYAKTDPDNLRATGWTAERVVGGRWVVTMHFLDSHHPKEANWEYDPATGKVRYLNPEAKNFSWSPAQ